MQGSGTISEVDANANPAAVLDQAAFYDPRQETYVDVASADQDRCSLTLERSFLLQQRRQGHGSSPFRECFLPFEQDHNCVGDLLFIHSDNLVDKAFHLRQSEISGTPD